MELFPPKYFIIKSETRQASLFLIVIAMGHTKKFNLGLICHRCCLCESILKIDLKNQDEIKMKGNQFLNEIKQYEIRLKKNGIK